MNKRLASIALGAAMSAVCLAACSSPSGGTDAEDFIKAVSPEEESEVCLANDIVDDYFKNYEKCYAEKYFDNGDQYFMKPLTLSWSSKEPALYYTVKLSRKKDFSAVDYATVTTETSVSVDPGELYVATTYYWQVRAEFEDRSVDSRVFRFGTADTIRAITIEGVSNTRDLGGAVTADGKHVKQGIVYRGARLDGVTELGKQQAKKFGFRTDLDLRGVGEGVPNPLGLENYIQISAPFYNGCLESYNWPALSSEIKVFADRANYPVFFHCSVGRDRTGSLAFLLYALLGVSEQDIYRDYEFSVLSEMGCLDKTPVSDLVNAHMNYLVSHIKWYGKGNLQENCEQFLLETGVTAEDIAAIREIMLED